MTGFLGFAPIYLNGLLALFCVFVLPGMIVARAFAVTDFPQRWFVVFLSSVTCNHLFVVLIALLHLDPVGSYRAAVAAMVAALLFLAIKDRRAPQGHQPAAAATVTVSDIRCGLLSLMVLSRRRSDCSSHL